MKKMIFRILGALASALIIVSVFVPFVSTTGYSQSLWQAHEILETLYLPIMIIIFGAIGVIFFSINIKTELAYTSSGALLFFLIMQTIPAITQGSFNAFGVGYYFLAIGTILTGIMAFLCNIKTKQKVVQQQVVEVPKEVSMIDQIDKLYNDQVPVMNTPENNNLDNIIQPLPIQNNVINNETPIVAVNNSIPDINQNNQIQSVVSDNTISSVAPVSLNDLSSENSTQIKVEEPVQSNTNNIPEITESQNTNSISYINQSQNPVVAEFSGPEMPTIETPVPQQNPVVSEFTQPADNPVVSEFSGPEMPTIETSAPQQNPVIAEFNNNTSTFIEPQSTEAPQEIPVVEPLQPLGSENKVDVMAAPTNNNNSNLDIFG